MSREESHGTDGDDAGTATDDQLPVDDADSMPTEDAFALLADETRLDIIRALGDTGPNSDPLTFSELRERVGVRDSGQFNYHLDKIRGEFVRYDEERDAYDITYAGVVVYQALVRGTFDHRAEVNAVETDIDCHECAGSYEASYSATSLFTLDCPDCASMLYFAHFPPRGLEDRSREEFLEAVDQWIRKDVNVFARGICPFCTGDVDTSLAIDDEQTAGNVSTDDRDFQFPHDERPMTAYVRYNCDRCRAQIFSTVGMHLLTHPAVVRFYDDHDVDLRHRPLWDLEFAASSGHVETHSVDPPRVAITIEEADDELELVVDETASVVERTRR